MSVYHELKTLLAQSISEMVGESAQTAIDADNLIDVGKQITSAWSADDFDTVHKSFIDKVNKTVYHMDEFTKSMTIMKDYSTYGSLLEKARIEPPDNAEIHRFDLENYTENVFGVSLPTADVKYFSKKGKFDLMLTLQGQEENTPYLKSAMASESALNAYFAAAFQSVQKKFSMENYQLCLLAVANAIAEKCKVHAQINLLALYKSIFTSSTVTADTAMYDKEFLRFAAMTIKKYTNRIKFPSVLYGNDGYANITNNSHFYVSSEFTSAIDSYLLADTFNAEKLQINDLTEMPYWQGIGTADDERMQIDIIPASEGAADSPDTRTEIVEKYVVGILFDDRAIACTANNLRTRVIFNPENEATNYFYHAETGFYNDMSENVIVFTVNDYNAVYLDTEPADWDKTDNVYFTEAAGVYSQFNDDFEAGWYFVAV